MLNYMLRVALHNSKTTQRRAFFFGFVLEEDVGLLGARALFRVPSWRAEVTSFEALVWGHSERERSTRSTA